MFPEIEYFEIKNEEIYAHLKENMILNDSDSMHDMASTSTVPTHTNSGVVHMLIL